MYSAVSHTEAQLGKEINIYAEDADIPVSLSGVASGVYFVEIAADYNRTVKKIVIE
ncbi:MAG TPA: T9SS type A sorting domain-containing protein [Flavobacterium sp.]|nr:T9SS type A sorting domain-containing protein [Flavobacterium sp.]